MYIADGGNNVVRMVSGGTITTIAGNNGSGLGYSGDGGPAVKAQLYNPTGVALDSSGNLYIADAGNNVIRKVASGGTITTFAGNVNNSGNGPGYGGDGGSATAIGALFSAPSAVALDSKGNLYIADSKNQSVREVSNGNLSTVVGILTTATKLNNPTGIAFDATGALYIADTGNRRVYKFAGGNLATFAGNGLSGFSGDNGPATAAAVFDPFGVAVDAAGNVYIADTDNSRIRKVSLSGTITTIAGNGRNNYTGDGGLATNASMYFPRGVAVDAAGNVYVADTNNNVIRLLQPVQAPTPAITANGVVNAASLAPQISPGCLATVFGTNFASGTVSANPPLQTALSGVSVSVNGRLAPILFVNGTQINFQVPWETSVGTATVTVSVNSTASQGASVPVTAAAPGLFAVAQNSDFSINSPSNPALVGSAIMTYLSGSGPVTPAVADGAATPLSGLVTATSTVTATIGGEPAQVPFAGLTPGLVAVTQVNIVVPSDLASGDYPVVVTIGTENSNSFTISVVSQ